MSTLSYPQWRSEQSYSNYPFVDLATLISTEGSYQIPRLAIVDASVYTSTIDHPIRLANISIDGAQGQITLRDSVDATVATATVDRDHYGAANLIAPDGTCVGVLVSGESGWSPLWYIGDGSWSFTDSALVADVVFSPRLSGVQSIGAGGKQVGINNVVLVAERGVQFELTDAIEADASGEQKPVKLIRIHAVGDPLGLKRNCSDPAYRPRRFVRRLVFQYGGTTYQCSPGPDGDVLILAGSTGATNPAIRIVPGNGTLKIDIFGQLLKGSRSG